MKKIISHVAIVASPYLFIIFIWCFSLGAFDYQECVMSKPFLAFASIYWLMIQWPVHMTMDE